MSGQRSGVSGQRSVVRGSEVGVMGKIGRHMSGSGERGHMLGGERSGSGVRSQRVTTKSRSKECRHECVEGSVTRAEGQTAECMRRYRVTEGQPERATKGRPRIKEDRQTMGIGGRPADSDKALNRPPSSFLTGAIVRNSRRNGHNYPAKM